MAVNVGHAVQADKLKIKRTTPTRVIFEGECGECFYIRVEDWPRLRTMVNSAIFSAKIGAENAKDIVINTEKALASETCTGLEITTSKTQHIVL